MALEGKNADYLICVCKKKTLGEVRDLIRSKSAKKISQLTKNS